MNVKEELKKLSDGQYRLFNIRLIPDVAAERILGVRIPLIRALAKRMSAEEKEAFLSELPHYYEEENVLHAVLLDGIKDFGTATAEVARFLPYVDNWAVCDAISPKAFGKKAESSRLRTLAYEWTKSPHLYTARYGVNCLRQYFLDDGFDADVLHIVAQVGGSYYLDMAAAWFFCDALIKRWDAAIVCFEEGKLSKEVHRKAVRKALDSFRVSAEKKAYLKSLPVPAE